MTILAILLSALLAQAPASVEGIVLKAGGVEPVPKALLELRNDADDSVRYTVAASSEGRFAFRNVLPGRYRIVATRSGYVRAEFGQRAPGKRGVAIEVLPGQPLSPIQLPLTPTGATHGRVYGSDGKPVIKATVQALKPQYQDGRRVLTPVQTTLTNDLGEYRLFWLTPGAYFIGATAPNWGVLGDRVTLNSAARPSPGDAVTGMRFSTGPFNPLAPLPRQQVREGRYLPVYFPNTSDDQAAESVDLQPGADLGGIDILLAAVRTRRIRGVVIDGETGMPLVNATPGYANSIRATPPTDGSSTIVNPATGEFDVQVVPGEVLVWMAGIGRTGSIVIPPGDQDLEGVQLVVTSGIRLSGRILIEGANSDGGDARLPSLRVTLRGDPRVFAINPPAESGVPDAAGRFTIQNVTAGAYRVNVAPILNLAAQPQAPPVPPALQNAYVKSIRLDDADVLNRGLLIESRSPDGPLVITIGTDPGSITGVVRAQDQPVSDATVALVPAEDHRQRVDLYKSTVSDSAGRFKLDRIPPGSYKMFAWDEVIPGAWQDSQFMRSYENQGRPVTVGEGSRQELNITVISR